MCVGIALTDNEEISRSVAEFAEIELNDIFALLVTDPLHDGMIEVFELRIFYPRCLFGCQNFIVRLSMQKTGSKVRYSQRKVVVNAEMLQSF